MVDGIWPERTIRLKSAPYMESPAPELSDLIIAQIREVIGAAGYHVYCGVLMQDDGALRLIAVTSIGHDDIVGDGQLLLRVRYERSHREPLLRLTVLTCPRSEPGRVEFRLPDQSLLPDAAAAVLDGLVAQIRALPDLPLVPQGKSWER